MVPPDRAPEELPMAYGSDRIALVPRAAGSLLAIWEITAEGVGDAKAALAARGRGAKLVLRVGSTTGGGSEHEVSDWLGRFYLFDLRPGASYRATLGLRASDGEIEAIAQCDPVEAPRDHDAPVPVEAANDWMQRHLVEVGLRKASLVEPATQSPDSLVRRAADLAGRAAEEARLHEWPRRVLDGPRPVEAADTFEAHIRRFLALTDLLATGAVDEEALGPYSEGPPG